MPLPLFDAATGNKVASGTTNTWSHTVTAAQSNLILFVEVDAGASLSSVKYNGVAMTQVPGASITYGGSETLSLWYLLAPATGANNVVVTASGTTFIIGVSASYYNAAQSSMFGTAATNSGTGTSSTNTVTTSNTNQLVIDALNNAAASTATATASQTKRFQPASSGAAEGDIAATGSNMTLTWSFTSGNWAQISVALNVASTNFTTTITEQLTSFYAEATTVANGNTTITEQLTTFNASPSSASPLQGVQTITEQDSSFSATATVTASLAPITIPGVSVFISNQNVAVLEGSIDLDDQISQVGTATFTVRDDTGTQHYAKSQQVLVNDFTRGVIFTGVIHATEEDVVKPSTLLLTKIDCVDNSYFAGKRTYPGPEYVNQYIGAIATDLLNYLTAEGITAHYAGRREITQGQFAAGTLSNVVASTNVNDGDLELAPAGADVTITENTTAVFGAGTLTNVQAASNTLVAVPTNAVKMTGVMNVPGISGAASFYKIWAGSYTIQTNDVLGYYVWVAASSPEIKATVDLVCTDGTHLRDQNIISDFDYSDENDIIPAPYSDLGGYAKGQWYYRYFSINGFAGKTLSYASVALGGQAVGSYTAYFRGIRVYNGATSATNLTIFSTSLLTSPQQIQNVGYENVVVSVVPTYNLQNYATINIPLDIVAATVTPGDASHERASTAYSLAGGVILKNSMISWLATEPANTKLVVRCALDNGTPVECTNNLPVPNLVPGMNLAGRSLTIYQDFYMLSGASPEDTPVLNSLIITVKSAPSSTKTDAAYTTTFSAGEAGASFSSTIGNSAILNLTGATRNWDLPLGTGSFITGVTSYATDQPSYLGTAGQTIFQRSYEFGNPSAGNESKTRFDFAGQHQNFTTEIDVQLFSDIQIGLVYRSTNLSVNNGSYAYAAQLSETGITLKRGTNTTGGGAATTIGTVSFTLIDKSWHRLKVVTNGSNHRVYLDDVLEINVTDATFGATGYLGAIGVSPSTAYPSFNFDNFGVMDALSGIWTSPNVSLNSVASYGNSYVSWRDRSQSPASNDTVLVQSSIDGGVTWQTCINGRPLQGLTTGQSLAGVNLKLMVTLSSTTAQSMPGIDNLYVVVLGQYSATGYRISPALPLINVGRIGNSLVAWNALLPTNTSLAVATSIDSGASWQSVGASGNAIGNVTGQPDPTIDPFTTNTSANYTSTFRSGGAAAIYTYDTANSRMTATGGTNALFVLNSLTGVSDVDQFIDLDQSDTGGMIWRYTDANNFYEAVVQDASSSGGTPNSLAVYKISAGVRTLLASAAISFVRGTPHRIRTTMIGGAIVAYFDGLQALTYTDGSPLAGGQCGLRTSGGTARFYQLRIQPQGQDVTSLSVQVKHTLTTTDPTVTPQILDTTIAAHNPAIGNGTIIPKTGYQYKYLSDAFNDLATRYPNGWWDIDQNKVFFLQGRTGTPAPWCLTGSDVQNSNLRVRNESTLFRNREIVYNVLATVALDVIVQGDGVTRSWSMGYQLAAAPTITVNGVPATVGIKGVDTGKAFYYTVGSETITQDTHAAVYVSSQTLEFIGTGQYTTFSQYDDTAGQATLATIEGGSGIVEHTTDGKGLTKAAGDALAQSLVQQNGVLGLTLDFTTLRDGLAIGQVVNVFLPEHALNNTLFLIRAVKTVWTPDPTNNRQQPWYTCQAISGPDAGDWTRLYKRTS